MKPQDFLLAIAQHPAGKYATTVAISKTWSVYFGETARIECSGYPGRRFRLWRGNQMNEFVVIESALDAALEILEPPRAGIPPGFVAVDKPTVDSGSGVYALGVSKLSGDMGFYASSNAAVDVTWLAIAPPVVSDRAREWLRCERVRWDERIASYRAISEIARALGIEVKP